MNITIQTGINSDGFSQYISDRAVERAKRDSLPNITPDLLRLERLHGVHQGVWEVVGKLIAINNPLCVELVKEMRPYRKHIHEFDFESLCDELGGSEHVLTWLNNFVYADSLLDELAFDYRDFLETGKIGDEVQSLVFYSGRELGIRKALDYVQCHSEADAFEVSCLLG